MIFAIGGGSIVDLGKGIVSITADTDCSLIAVPTTYSGAEITKGLMIVKGPRDKKSVYDEVCRPQCTYIRQHTYRYIRSQEQE